MYCHHFDFFFLDTNLGIFGRRTGRGKEKKRGKKPADIGRRRRRRRRRGLEEKLKEKKQDIVHKDVSFRFVDS